MNTDTQILAHHSESHVYAAALGVMDSSRVTLASPALLVAMVRKIAAEGDGVAADLPVSIAGHGVVAIGEIGDDVELPEPGELGYKLETIGTRGIKCDDGKTRNGITGLSVYPAHGIDSILEHASGRAYLQGLADKEQGLVAFRSLRLDPETDTVADMAAGAAAMPITVDDFLVRTRKGAASPYAVYNDNWSDFLKAAKANGAVSKTLAQRLPTKAAMLSCIRSEAYARQHYPALEDSPKGSLIVRLATLFANAIAAAQAAAEKTGEDAPSGDPQQVFAWLDARADVDLTGGDVSADALDIDDSAFGL